LHRTSARSGRGPERFLSAAFLFWALGYVLYDVPYLLFTDPAILAPFFFGWLVSIQAGTFALALFNRAVFRRDAQWATWLVVATGGGMLAGFAGSAWIGDWTGEHPMDSVAYWPELAATCLPSIWMAAEGLNEHRKARQRERLGLCDPFTRHRFLLWGAAGSFWALLELVGLAQELQLALEGRSSALSDGLSALCELAPIALVWLAFYPPAAYRRWVERGSLAPAAA
jgi:hypothetical protein